MSRLIGVCSWSLQARDPEDLVWKVTRIGVQSVQLALDTLRPGEWATAEVKERLAAAELETRSGMMRMHGEDYASLETIRRTGGVRPHEHWAANLAAAKRNAELAAELGIGLVTFHAGFIPPDPSDANRRRMLDRLRTLADVFADQGVRMAFETGQETAETLLGALHDLDRPETGVNFDPANMILYGQGDPVAALKLLAGRVAQIHVKDAIATTCPGTWGREVPVGRGDVNWPAFFEVYRQTGLNCDLIIERERGDECISEIRQARDLIEQYL